MRLEYFTVVGDISDPECFRLKFKGYKEYHTHDKDFIIKIMDILDTTKDNDVVRAELLSKLIALELE